MLLFLNDIAGSEILLILVFILIFFGSKSIPGIARTMGKTIRQIKDASQEVQNEIKKSGMNIKKDMDLSSLIRETADDIRKPLDQMAVDVNEAMESTSKPYSTPRQLPKKEETSEGEVANKVDVIPPESIEPAEPIVPTVPVEPTAPKKPTSEPSNS
jgi:sec-independent protein translocase protein TatA